MLKAIGLFLPLNVVHVHFIIKSSICYASMSYATHGIHLNMQSNLNLITLGIHKKLPHYSELFTQLIQADTSLSYKILRNISSSLLGLFEKIFSGKSYVFS